MTQAQITVAVMAARFGTGGALSPLTAGAFETTAVRLRTRSCRPAPLARLAQQDQPRWQDRCGDDLHLDILLRRIQATEPLVA